MTPNANKAIEDVYYNLSSAGAYAGPRKIYEILKQNHDNAPSLYKIRQWLQSKDDYTLLKPVRRKFKTARVNVSEPFEQFDIDLMDLSSISTFNDHFRYILIVIDVFSICLWVEPLKTKTGKEVLKALTAIFDRSGYPKKLRNDSGGEFTFSGLSKFLKNKNIYQHFALNSTMKANYAERVILILTLVLFRYFIKNRTHRFIDKLQDFVNSSNSTPHSSLAYTAPKDVNDNNQSDLWVYMYLKKQKLSKNSLKEPKKTKRHFIFRKGDMVRISHLSRVFQKSYEQQWTSEIF
jgi:transposase InsO family protein